MFVVFLKYLQQITFDVGPRFQTFSSQREKLFDDFLLLVSNRIILKARKNKCHKLSQLFIRTCANILTFLKLLQNLQEIY